MIPAFLPALGPALFAALLNRDQGNWNAFIDVQEQWNRYSAMPWETLRCAISTCHTLGGEPDGISWSWLQTLLSNPSWDTITSQSWRADMANSDVLELVVTVLFVGLAAIGLKLLPVYQTLWILPGLLIPLVQPSEVHALMSMPRFVLVLFPLFIVLGTLLQPRWLRIPAVVVSVLLLVVLTTQFALWYWVS